MADFTVNYMGIYSFWKTYSPPISSAIYNLKSSYMMSCRMLSTSISFYSSCITVNWMLLFPLHKLENQGSEIKKFCQRDIISHWRSQDKTEISGTMECIFFCLHLTSKRLQQSDETDGSEYSLLYAAVTEHIIGIWNIFFQWLYQIILW